MADNLSREDRSWCMSQIRSRGMKPELFVRSMVHRLGYRFRLHRRGMPGKPDLVLPRYRTVIFVNGCFWHWHPDPSCPIAGLPKTNLGYWEPKLTRTRIRDREHTASLEAEGSLAASTTSPPRSPSAERSSLGTTPNIAMAGSRCSPRTTCITIEPRACWSSAGGPFKPPGPVIPNASFEGSQNRIPFPKPSGSTHL